MSRVDELKDSLTDLATKLKNVPNDAAAVQKISQAIATLNSPELDEPGFVKSLKELAQAVIYARAHASNDVMKHLPVPPYDLWLPFKAKNLRPFDNSDLGKARAVANTILGGLGLPERDPQLEKQVDRFKAQGRS